MAKNNNCGCDTGINNVACTAKQCSFHGEGDTCHASHIKVANENACTCGETFCSTYKKK